MDYISYLQQILANLNLKYHTFHTFLVLDSHLSISLPNKKCKKVNKYFINFV